MEAKSAGLLNVFSAAVTGGAFSKVVNFKVYIPLYSIYF